MGRKRKEKKPREWKNWTETKESRQKKQDIFQKSVDNKENIEVFFEDLAWKTNVQEKLITKRRKTRSLKKKKQKNQRYFIVILPKLNDNFSETQKEDW